MNNSCKIIVAVIILLSSFCSFAAQVNKILITGNQRVENATIQEYLHINVGDEYSASRASEAIKSLYATSLFEDINIEYNDGLMVVRVVETPFVSSVVFKGNSKIKTNVLENEIHTIAGESLKKSKLTSDIEKIKEMYKRAGRFAVQVKAQVNTQENNRVKVIFDIVEGPKTGIKAIYFVGNENYKSAQLKKIILTKESRWFSFLETNDTYDPDRIEFDKYLLASFYNSVGFADFRMISVTADLLYTKEGFILTYSMDEGSKYNFGKMKLENMIPKLNEQELTRLVDNHEGQLFSSVAIERTIDKISNYLASNGYAHVDIKPKMVHDYAKRIVDVTLVIDQAEKVLINKINISGNLKTEDHVIRRQFKIAEGDTYNRRKIEQAERNIQNLDYFSKVSLGMSPTQDVDRYDINVNVLEKSTSSIGLDVGYNTASGMFGRLSFIERNLIGTGKYLNMGVQVGRKNVYYYLGITEPNFMDKDVAIGWNVFKSDQGKGQGFNAGENNYASRAIGGSLTLGYDLAEDLMHEIEYSLKQEKIMSENCASILLREQAGKFITSAVSHSITYDKTDSRIIPKNGYLIVGSQGFAGLGGDDKYLKHELEGKFFKSFIENKYTIKLIGAAGHIRGISKKKVRIADRFNLGEYTLRGFASGGVGPRDITSKEGLGGQKYYRMSTELGFPLGLPPEFDVTGAVFVDAGTVWDVDAKATQRFYNNKSLRSSVGFGVQWVTRFAPIRLDWGFPIKKQKYDETQTFHLKFSTHL